MAIINKTSEMEYCEKCGTMLVSNICRQCGAYNFGEFPVISESTKVKQFRNKSTKVKQFRNKSTKVKQYTSLEFNFGEKTDTHIDGARAVAKMLDKEKIAYHQVSNYKTTGYDFILINNDHKTINVRVRTVYKIIALNDSNNIKSDFIIIVTKYKNENYKFYCITTNDARKKCYDLRKNDNDAINEVIDEKDYLEYRDNYNILKVK